MKIQYFSDVHVETNNFQNFKISPIGDLLFLCGDVGVVENENYFHFLNYLSKLFCGKKIILISGNHEYYSKNKICNFDWIEETNYKIKKFCKDKNIIFLDNEIFKIPDTKYIIFGSTFWSKIRNEESQDVLKYVNDFKSIPLFSITDYLILHNTACDKLNFFLETYSNYKFIILTHHLPSFSLLYDYNSEKDYAITIDSAFATEIQILKSNQIEKWFCGHYHKTKTNG